MTQGEIERRQIVNEYFNKPKDQTKVQFCKIRKIKCYQLDRMIELYGQKLVPGIKEIANRYHQPTPSGMRLQYVDSFCEDTRNLIAIELSDSEYPEYLRNSADERLTIQFERTRLKLLVQIIMMKRNRENLSSFSRVYKELCNE